MRRTSVPFAVVVCAVASPANAQVVESDYADYEAPATERRGGFMLGLGAVGGFGNVRGYPNEISQINVPEFERAVDGFSFGNALWIGGAIRDWLTFGVGLSTRVASSGEFTAQNQAFMFNLEGFPLYALGGEWRDVGVSGQFGAGGALIVDEEEDTVADGGLMSIVGFSAFYEPWQFWHFSTGPTLSYTHEFSETLRSHTLAAGMRFVFYGDQPR
jgi:hypothetical protein